MKCRAPFTIALVVLLLAAFEPPLASGYGQPVVMVTDPGDTGSGTLRWALENVPPGGAIVFDPMVFPPAGSTVIEVRSELPPLAAGGVTLDAAGAGVHLAGDRAPLGTPGLTIASDGNMVRGLVITGFDGPGVWVTGAGNRLEENHLRLNRGAGVLVEGVSASGNVLLGNLIGLTADGRAEGNGASGILLRGGARQNLIGLTRAQANVVAANGGDGVRLEGAATGDNRVAGNFIGLDRLGHAGLGNVGCGVRLAEGASQNQVGGAVLGAGNVVAGNGAGGICLQGADVRDNEVTGNQVGTTLSGLMALPNEGPGLVLEDGASGNTISENLISGNRGDGLVLRGAGTEANFVLGNRIGLNAVGAAALPNAGAGVLVEGGAAYNVIGRVAEGEENLVGGNAGPGVWLRGQETRENVVAGNRIGTDFGGFQAVGNDEDGLRLGDGTQGNLAICNLISGNQANGVLVEGPGTEGNLVAGNVVGMDLARHGPLPNGGHGVHLAGGASGNRIGEPAVAAQALWARAGDVGRILQGGMGNLVAHNGSDGVRIEGVATVGNSLHRNSITANGGAGIRLVAGGNGSVAAPVISGATSSGAAGQGCAGCLVELFTDEGDEGASYQGMAWAGADGSFTFAGPLRGPNLTATATDAQGNTSAFSDPMAVGGWAYLPLTLVSP